MSLKPKATPDYILLPGDPQVPVWLRRSAQARRLSLRVSALDGRVTLSVPKSLKRGAAEKFLVEKADWVRGHLATHPAEHRLALGGVVPVEGRDVPIRAGPGQRAALRDDGVYINAGLPVPPQVAAVLKARARGRLAAACDGHAGQVGCAYSVLSLRDTRSRWGSCSSAGRLMFSWRLIMAPPEILDYVAAHEVAHLIEMNHSAAFWAVVGQLCPDYARRRRWLRDHGARLHAVRFSA